MGRSRAEQRSPPSADDIAAIGERLLAGLPEPFRTLVTPVPIAVRDWPGDDQLDEVGIEDALDLTGLFVGPPLDELGNAALTGPTMIFLFRLPILHEWCERACPLEDVVTDVLTHEIGHYFRMTEEEVRHLESRGG